jgi:RHS repeat-associated protein
MKTTWTGWLPLMGAVLLPHAQAEIGTRVIPPSERGYSVESIRESGERGGMLLTAGTNFTAAHNREMGEAMELWNAHRWQEGVEALGQIWRAHPDSPWAAEAEMHEACYLKFNGRFDEAEERFVSVLAKYPHVPEIQAKVLHYLPHLYALTARWQAALDTHLHMGNLPLTWQERQHLETYSRIFSRGVAREEKERLCGTKALALALAAQNDNGETLRNVSVAGIYRRFDWATRKSAHGSGYSLQELADLCNGTPVELDLDALRQGTTPGHPVLVYLKSPSEPKCFGVLQKPSRGKEQPLTGHFVVVERTGQGFVDLLEPNLGRMRWPMSHFLYRWSGAALKLPGQDALKGRSVSAVRAGTMRGGCCGFAPPPPCDDPCCQGGGGAGGGGGSGGGGVGGRCGGVGGLNAIAGGCGPGGGSGGGGGSSGCCGEEQGNGAPIYRFGLASANLQLKDIPIWYPGAKGPPLMAQLVYNRIATERMAQYTNANFYPFGNKWHFNFSSFLTEGSDNSVEIVLPGGRVQRFLRDGDDYVSADVWNNNVLGCPSGLEWFVLEFSKSGNKWYFNTNTAFQQRLEKIEDPYGNAVTLQYDSGTGRLTNIVDAIGRFLQLKYNTQGYVTNVTDMLGRAAVFGYSPDHDLISMTDMGGLTTTIQYDTNHWPTNIVYPSEQAWNIHYKQGDEVYTQPFRMQVADPLDQTNGYYFVGTGPEGPITLKDRTGNEWTYNQRAVGDTERIYETFVNGTDTWDYRLFDVEANPIYIITKSFQGCGEFCFDVQVTNLYDGRHNLLSSTLITNATPWDEDLRVVGTWTNWYDNRDNLLGTMNPLNQITRYVYDDKDKVIFITNALNQVTRMRYDSNGNLTNLVDALNRTNRWLFNVNGLETESLYPDGLRITKGYDTIGRLNAVTNHGSGLFLEYTYDDLDRLRDTIFPDATSNHFEYACCGLDWTRDRLNRVTHYGRDALGRTSSVTDPENRLTEFKYNGADQITNLITHVAGRERVKQFDYTSTNGFSRLTQVTTPMGKLIRYDYTFRGGLASREDGNGNVTKYLYDPLGRLTTVTDSNDVVLVSMEYDVLGNVKHVASTHSVFDYTYDDLNRATQAVCTLTNVPGFATVKYRIDYWFDGVGNITNRVITGLQGMSDTITTRYAFDVMNRLTNVVQLTNAVESARAGYQYDSAGRLWKKSYGNDDVATHAYDSESRLLSLGITNSTTLVTCYTYGWDAGGNILAITNNGTNVTLYGYDCAGQLTNELAFTNGIVGSVSNSWQYDAAGNWLNAGAGAQWHYNLDNELMGKANSSYTNWSVTITGEVEPGPQSNKWYNTTAQCRGVEGQVSANNGTFSLTNVPVYPGTNALVVAVMDVSGNLTQEVRHVSKSAQETFGYEGNGNVTNWVTATVTWAYEWDWADRLTKVTSNGIVVLQNWYDANSRRIAKQEVVNGQTKKWLHLYDGWNIIAVMNENGQIAETFTRGVGIAGDIGTLVAVTHHGGANAGTYYAHHNHRGDVTVMRSGTTTVGAYGYSAFGLLTSASGPDLCRFKFSSKEREESCGFSYYGFRFYAPQWQRWQSKDPIGEEGGNNLYLFVDNAPKDQVDAYGLDSTKDPPKPKAPTPKPPKAPPQFEPIPTPKPGSACADWCSSRRTAGDWAEIDCLRCCTEMFSQRKTHPFSLKNIGWMGWYDSCRGTCEITRGVHGPDVPRPK